MCVSSLETYFQTEKPILKIDEFMQVKLTIDFLRMVVIEETFSPPISDKSATDYFFERKLKKFVSNEYQCQSLGVTVPKIDTSQSLTPIGRDL